MVLGLIILELSLLLVALKLVDQVGKGSEEGRCHSRGSRRAALWKGSVCCGELRPLVYVHQAPFHCRSRWDQDFYQDGILIRLFLAEFGAKVVGVVEGWARHLRSRVEKQMIASDDCV